MTRPQTAEAYAELVRQALFEAEDLRACLEREVQGRQSAPVFLDPLQDGLKALYESMKDGSYGWGREDLPFMSLARKHALQIPFANLLEQINLTHRRGLDVEGEDKW